MRIGNAHLLVGGTLLLVPLSAFAWDPNAGEDQPVATNTSHTAAHYNAPAPTPVYSILPLAVAPAAPTVAPVATPVAYVPASPAVIAPPAPAPAAMRPVSAVAAAPVAVTPVYTAAPVAMPAPAATIAPTPMLAPIRFIPATPDPIAVAPAYVAAPAVIYSEAPIDSSLRGPNRFALGIEGFYDRYQEPLATVDSRSGYGSLTGEFTHYFAPEWFGEFDARGSYGQEHYHSVSGTSDGTDQWEFESRLLAGYDLDYLEGRHIKPYIGVGARYYVDDGKGTVTNTGAHGYERRITQYYMPVGATYEFPYWGLQFAPKLEYDPLLYGRVSTHLGEVPGYYDIENDQHGGSGWRTELMMGDVNEQGVGWQFGPFLRTWNMRTSKIATSPPTPQGTSWIEPHNTRLQAGAELKFLF